MKFNLKQGALGDKLAIIYMLENAGRLTGTKHVLCGSTFLGYIFSLFDLKYVQFHLGYQRSRGVKDLYKIHRKIHSSHFVCSANVFFRKRFGLNPYSCKPLIPHIPYQPKDNRTLIQFDGRTCKRKRVAMTRGKMERAVKNLASYKISVIGGLETTKYMGYKVEYRLGDLYFINREMLSCKEFLGCDSGMSHLSGVLGIPSNIVILHKSMVLRQTYTMYPNTTIYNRNLHPIYPKVL